MSDTENSEQILDRISTELNQSPRETIGYDRIWIEQFEISADEIARQSGRTWRLGVHYQNDPDRNMTLRTALIIFEPKEQK